ncbi:hypothetical protein K4F52_009911 [Lecanicillium sp. MT-2017a]|nr:hypothetical protein K4F52_009911 [Lecanicillium sp. MT-2017a]
MTNPKSQQYHSGTTSKPAAAGSSNHRLERIAPDRLKPDSTSLHRFSKPKSAPWTASLSGNDTFKLLKGYKPESMDDRWEIYTEGPNDKGHVTVRIYRSWTGLQTVSVWITASVTKDNWITAGRVTQINWETDWNKLRGYDAEESKDTVKALCKTHFGVTFME